MSDSDMFGLNQNMQSTRSYYFNAFILLSLLTFMDANDFKITQGFEKLFLFQSYLLAFNFDQFHLLEHDLWMTYAQLKVPLHTQPALN